LFLNNIVKEGYHHWMIAFLDGVALGLSYSEKQIKDCCIMSFFSKYLHVTKNIVEALEYFGSI